MPLGTTSLRPANAALSSLRGDVARRQFTRAVYRPGCRVMRIRSAASLLWQWYGHAWYEVKQQASDAELLRRYP